MQITTSGGHNSIHLTFVEVGAGKILVLLKNIGKLFLKFCHNGILLDDYFPFFIMLIFKHRLFTYRPVGFVHILPVQISISGQH